MREVRREVVWWEVGDRGFTTLNEARYAAYVDGAEVVEQQRRLEPGYVVEVGDWLAVVDLRDAMSVSAPVQVYRVVDGVATVRAGASGDGPRSWRTSVDARGVLLPLTRSAEPCGLFSGWSIGVAGSTVEEALERARVLMDMHRDGELL